MGSMNHTSCCPTSLYRIHFPLLCDAKLHNQKGRIKFYVDRLKDREEDRRIFRKSKKHLFTYIYCGKSIAITHTATIISAIIHRQEAAPE